MRRILWLCCIALSIGLLAMPASAQKVTAGEHIQDILETPHPYPSSGKSEPEVTWIDQVSYPGATYIAVHFAHFDLAPGDFVVVRTPDNKYRWTYTGQGRANLGTSPEGFFATHVVGDVALVELHTTGSSSGYGYRIDYYGRGYNDVEIEQFWAAGLGEKMNLPIPASMEESVCTTDDTKEAKCYQASNPDAYDKSRAVARLLLNGSAWCTGWLIGCEGHVMTNEHCITDQSQANNIDFEFNAEGATCATNCASALACPGTIEASGGTLVAVNAALDYALVLPDTTIGGGTDLNATYGYLQLRESGAVLNERIYIPQHPAGWGKRLALESSYPDDADGFAHVNSLNETPCSGGPGDIGYWADTQGGSSGSPVLAISDNRVVSLHHCRGSAFCSTGNSGTDDPNRGLAIEDVIASLGASLPNCATCQPPTAPSGLSVTPAGDNELQLQWTAGSGTSTKIYRALGGCPGSGYELIASGVAGNTYTDTTVSGDITYSYVVSSVDDSTSCESVQTSCASATATGVCTLEPNFLGVTTVTNEGLGLCTLTLDWTNATANCGAGVVYNVYRSSDMGFTPGATNLVASCVNDTTWSDAAVIFGKDYHYIVRAEDASGNGSGPCAGGNEDTNSIEVTGSPSGPDTESVSDDIENGSAGWATSAGPTNTSANAWSIVTTASHSATHAWFVSDEAQVKDQNLRFASPIAVPSGSAVLEFWHRFNTEPNFDGGVLEYSLNGTTWFDILNGNATRFIEGGYTSTLGTGFSNPLPGRSAWSGDNTAWERVQVDLSDFGGQNLHLRWRFGCDSSVGDAGWWVDDVRVFVGSECTAGNLIFDDGFESGNISSWFTSFPAP